MIGGLVSHSAVWLSPPSNWLLSVSMQVHLKRAMKGGRMSG